MHRQQYPPSGHPALQLGGNILPRQQTGHIDGVAEKVVLHGDHLRVQPWEVGLRLVHQRLHKGRGGHAGGNGKGAGHSIRLLHFHGGQKFLLQRTQHPHAVFQLAVALVVLLLRQGKSRPQEQLVGTEEPPGTEAGQILLPEFLRNGNDLPGAVPIHRPQPGKTLAVLGDTHRHQRAAGKLPVRQVPQGTPQRVAVVPAGAHHDLSVHDDACLAEGLDILQ